MCGVAVSVSISSCVNQTFPVVWGARGRPHPGKGSSDREERWQTCEPGPEMWVGAEASPPPPRVGPGAWKHPPALHPSHIERGPSALSAC